MSLAEDYEVTVDGITYDVEHSVDGNMERIILWGNPTKLIGDAFVDHNKESITVHIHTGEERQTESYDYWEFANTEDKEVAVDELARWIGAMA